MFCLVCASIADKAAEGGPTLPAFPLGHAHNRCNFSQRFVNCILINYPAAEKRQWDGVVTRISHTLASNGS